MGYLEPGIRARSKFGWGKHFEGPHQPGLKFINHPNSSWAIRRGEVASVSGKTGLRKEPFIGWREIGSISPEAEHRGVKSSSLAHFREVRGH